MNVTPINQTPKYEPTTYLINEESWRNMCNKMDKWCPYEEVKGMSIENAKKYIKEIQA